MVQFQLNSQLLDEAISKTGFANDIFLSKMLTLNCKMEEVL